MTQIQEGLDRDEISHIFQKVISISNSRNFLKFNFHLFYETEPEQGLRTTYLRNDIGSFQRQKSWDKNHWVHNDITNSKSPKSTMRKYIRCQDISQVILLSVYGDSCHPLYACQMIGSFGISGARVSKAE